MREKECDIGAATKMGDAMDTDEVVTVFQRVKEKKPCPFGVEGTCCRVCFLGPCRVRENDVGVCGATTEAIAAKNFGRMIAAGTAAHSDHAREVALLLLATARGQAPGYEIRDEQKLRRVAELFELDVNGKGTNQLAQEVAEKALAEFGKQEGELPFVKRAPARRQQLWRKLGVVPRGIDREVVEMMHRTSMGVDQDYRHLMLHGCRTALADGWGGSMIATELQDILFGTPAPLRAKVNLGVLKEDQVNIIVHGHEPLLPEMIIRASQDPELLALARSKGAKGINIAGICCTANEILMRHGIPLAGSFLQQELALMTGAVETMVVDVQCIMQSLPTVAQCYHTEIVTTSEKAKIPGAIHLPFHAQNAFDVARQVVKRTIENYPNRGKRGKVNIPPGSLDLVAGFSHETVNYMLGGSFRSSYRPLNDNIINGRIRGVVGVVGCNNPRVRTGYVHTTLLKELIANDVLVLTTGCGALTAARAGLLIPEAAELAGSGLREVCEAVGMPPVLHMGSCVDNSRILVAASEIVTESGLGEDIYQVPAAGCAPEWMSEKAVAIGQYFVASGMMVVFGVSFPTSGSEILSNFLFKEIEDLTGGMWVFEPDPLEMARILIERIDAGRKALGIDKKRERILYDMEMRRKLTVS
ncbi:anaerobic carbon-monoxide dehydrogenase catalytic subunit [Candidatus Hakubella thermalkaliphila]|uniref:Carbon monoxide dehydrogenase n=2 Tax=Candidatus Hakubella thermalkaliphila TaxID=2754717 RepID=A0A6V8QA04_9ACTN|nr:anaerobic carbon-monoxide dehydrogenase catalytic subunit [Candidatus Hakubella thermalkaliphila]MBT9170288.1 Carbon monoxide dehydrogenase 1 [Actinomycetota bacterium]GFP19263.1 anaerobic carbon-monoxide dehydrogenase catalytic subunit [Candidatus Hakubella thermalkaliphila]GFP23401.1 anaerobic carbon-monoxide dehydrogenase catalytic subunit [Candidatus Hakubella thermalkaliphila]GFP38741.1 anaerobic carbon-monoxide dehydrogenase catalytic subunit [Candidatus Hakubella thermalkaliphila]GFP